MRTLELRLAEDVYYGPDMPPGLGRVGREGWSEFDQARVQAALEFFDRALAGALSGGVALMHEGAHAAFLAAQDATLLRFGVRIIGLEEESHA